MQLGFFCLMAAIVVSQQLKAEEKSRFRVAHAYTTLTTSNPKVPQKNLNRLSISERPTILVLTHTGRLTTPRECNV